MKPLGTPNLMSARLELSPLIDKIYFLLPR